MRVLVIEECVAHHSLEGIPARVRDPAGGEVGRGVHEDDPLEAQLVEAVRRRRTRQPGREPAAAKRREHAVPDLREAALERDVVQRDPADEAAVLSHRPLHPAGDLALGHPGKGVRLDAYRPQRDSEAVHRRVVSHQGCELCGIGGSELRPRRARRRSDRG